MKHIFLLLSFSFCLFFSLLAQNPYVELSYPWLNQQQVKENKIKSIMLATMNDNGNQEKQLLLKFDNTGNLVSEESQMGFRYTNVLLYDSDGLLSMVVSKDGESADSTDYYYDSENRFWTAVSYKLNESERMWDLRIAKYFYDSQNRLTSYVTESGFGKKNTVTEDFVPATTDTTVVSRQNNTLKLQSPDLIWSWIFSDKGLLLRSETWIVLYNMTETSLYDYDQNGRLVLITWEQTGSSTKTFVTYEFYE